MSLYIAKIFGPILAIVAVSVLLNSDKYLKIVDDFFENFILCYITSVAIMAVGLVMIQAHNIWIMGWEVVLTVFAWLMFTKGALILLFPGPLAAMTKAVKDKKYFMMAGVVYLCLGVWLSAKGYAIL